MHAEEATAASPARSLDTKAPSLDEAMDFAFDAGNTMTFEEIVEQSPQATDEVAKKAPARSPPEVRATSDKGAKQKCHDLEEKRGDQCPCCDEPKLAKSPFCHKHKKGYQVPVEIHKANFRARFWNLLAQLALFRASIMSF